MMLLVCSLAKPNFLTGHHHLYQGPENIEDFGLKALSSAAPTGVFHFPCEIETHILKNSL